MNVKQSKAENFKFKKFFMKFIFVRALFIFLTAFLLNFIWENWHSQFYVHYKGGEITQFILFRATLFDAFFITFLILILSKIRLLNKTWIFVLLSIVAAVLIEVYALNTGRWAYGNSMVVLPFIDTGLTPTIQLAFLGYITKRLWIFKH